MNNFGSDIAYLWSKYSVMYLDGIEKTIVLALLGTAVGCLIGFLCGLLQTIPVAPGDNPVKKFFLALLRVVIRIYVELFRGTPMILQAVFIYYGLPYITGGAAKFSSTWLAAFLIVSINTGAYMAESVRGGILSVDPGQTEGAKAIGMTHFQTMSYVVLPQALRNIMPQIGNNLIINIKDTSIMFIIGFSEFFAEHRAIVGTTNKYFPSATIEMGGYLIMTVVCSIILRQVEKKMDGDDSYALVQADPLTMTAGTYNYSGSTADRQQLAQEKAAREARGNRNQSTRGDR
jgi:putative lysine transport system permease protein